MLQEEYYVIDRENRDHFPLFSWDQMESEYGMGKPVKYAEPIKLCLSEPISPEFEWVDYHKLPGPVISKRILDALLPLDLYGVQFVPAKVRNPKDTLAEPRDYWFVHVWNRIACLDEDASEVERYKDGSIFEIEELVLDEEKLGMFEPRKRMVFELAEDISVILVHKEVKKAIESVQPKGVRFFKATEWNSDICFED